LTFYSDDVLPQRLELAFGERARADAYFDDISAGLDEQLRDEWEKMISDWNEERELHSSERKVPNPFLATIEGESYFCFVLSLLMDRL
jgi:hypothetical protein